MNKNLRILTALLLILGLTGCGDIQKTIKRKFTPKKKETQTRKTFYAYEEDYRAEFPNATLYNNHYIYWKSWEQELIEALKDNNNKKQTACLQFSINELLSMQKYLVSPKKEELAPFISELDKMSNKISQGSLSDGTRATLRVALERHRRQVLNAFYLNKIKDFIKPDELLPPPAENEEE